MNKEELKKLIMQKVGQFLKAVWGIYVDCGKPEVEAFVDFQDAVYELEDEGKLVSGKIRNAAANTGYRRAK